MRPTFNHSLITSFALYLDNQLLNGLQAYTNVATGLYKQTGFNGVNCWASPWKSWVYDACTSGANVPTGFYNSSGQFLTRSSGLVIDFLNGRVYSPQNWGAQLSGDFARKDYNVYTSTEGEVGLVLENIYGQNPNITYSLTGASSKFAAPCIFVTNAQSENDPFALGGLNQTRNTLRCYIVSQASKPFAAEGVDSYLRDMSYQYFSLVPMGVAPFISVSGDLKSGRFCYPEVCSQFGVAGVYIEDTHSLKIGQPANGATSFTVSIAEIDTNTLRQSSISK